MSRHEVLESLSRYAGDIEEAVDACDTSVDASFAETMRACERWATRMVRLAGSEKRRALDA